MFSVCILLRLVCLLGTPLLELGNLLVTVFVDLVGMQALNVPFADLQEQYTKQQRANNAVRSGNDLHNRHALAEGQRREVLFGPLHFWLEHRLEDVKHVVGFVQCTQVRPCDCDVHDCRTDEEHLVSADAPMLARPK